MPNRLWLLLWKIQQETRPNTEELLTRLIPQCLLFNIYGTLWNRAIVFCLANYCYNEHNFIKFQIVMDGYEKDSNNVSSARLYLCRPYQDNEQRQHFSLLKLHRKTIIVAILDFIIILYSIIGIANVGFEKALGLFIIGMFGFVCLTWMAIRDTCGAVIYNWLCKTVIDRINVHWKYLRWYW